MLEIKGYLSHRVTTFLLLILNFWFFISQAQLFFSKAPISSLQMKPHPLGMEIFFNSQQGEGTLTGNLLNRAETIIPGLPPHKKTWLLPLDNQTETLRGIFSAQNRFNRLGMVIPKHFPFKEWGWTPQESWEGEKIYLTLGEELKLGKDWNFKIFSPGNKKNLWVSLLFSHRNIHGIILNLPSILEVEAFFEKEQEVNNFLKGGNIIIQSNDFILNSSQLASWLTPKNRPLRVFYPGGEKESKSVEHSGVKFVNTNLLGEARWEGKSQNPKDLGENSWKIVQKWR